MVRLLFLTCVGFFFTLAHALFPLVWASFPCIKVLSWVPATWVKKIGFPPTSGPAFFNTLIDVSPMLVLNDP